ncbi:MAG: hypothetical protein WC341_15725 [Bacteroidales bacterium]|jgi:hypothetical protein
MIKGIFVSVWDGETEIRTPATLDDATGEVTTESVEGVDEDGEEVEILDREYFESEDGEEFEICPECHSHILKTEIREGVGKQLYEVKVCMNPDCDYEE